MLFIVAHHYVVNSGVIALTYEDPMTKVAIFYRLFGAWGKTGINIFVLITGYFMCQSSISIKKYVKLIAEIEFYRISIYFLFVIFKVETVSFIGIIKALFPIIGIKADFISCFLIFYLLIPFINILLNNISKRQHLQIIAILLFVYSGLGFIPDFVNMNYVSWFIVVYFIASYIRIYPNVLTESVKRSFALMAVSLLLSVLSIFICAYAGKAWGMQNGYYFVSDSNKLLAVCLAIGTFLTFKNLRMKNSKIINLFGASTFGVLLIHANSGTMRTWLWGNVVNTVKHYDMKGFWLYATVSVVIVFVICTFLDWIRIATIEKLFMQFYEKCEKRLKKYQ